MLLTGQNREQWQAFGTRLHGIPVLMLRDVSQGQMSCLLIFESVLMPVLPTSICFEHHQYFSQPSALDFTVTHFWMHCSVSVIDLMIMGCICLLRPWNKEVGSREGVDFHAKYQPQEPRHDPEFTNQWGQIFFISSCVYVCSLFILWSGVKHTCYWLPYVSSNYNFLFDFVSHL